MLTCAADAVEVDNSSIVTGGTCASLKSEIILLTSECIPVILIELLVTFLLAVHLKPGE